MRKSKLYLKSCSVIFLTTVSFHVSFAQVEFSRGVNLTNWFQAASAQQIQFTRFVRQDFVNIKSLGCDVIRLPINLHAMTSGDPDWILDPLFLNFLDSAVTWAEELGIHLLIDNHTFDPAANTDPQIGPILIKVWAQMAYHYKDRSEYIYYEILNEPHGILDQLWGDIQQSVIDTIRAIDPVHTIIVGPAGWNSYNNLNALPYYSDTNLIYTFHFYDPFMFTHQGASWVNPSMVPLAGVPFPYDSAGMPSCPAELTGTWIESSLNNYKNDGTVKRVQDLISLAVGFKNHRGVRLFCGEFGVFMPNSDEPDRVLWYNTVSDYLEKNGIAWTIWDYRGGFGIFEEGSAELFEHDLNIPLIEALGLNVPEQTEPVIKPDSTGFKIYFEYVEEKIAESSWAGNGIISFYSTENPYAGNYCINWSDGSQYNFIGFDFRPDKDLSYLVDNDYAINFYIKGSTPNARFDIRFLDTKTEDPDDHPWRMKYTINNLIASWDGLWHNINIPLKSFFEGGSWDNSTWYNPAGDFDWKAVDRFEIVAEYSDMTGVGFNIDNLRVTNIPVSVNDRLINTMEETSIKIFPDPVCHDLTILYSVEKNGPVEISIFNIMGQKITTLLNEDKIAGDYTFYLNLREINDISVSEGLYFCRIVEAGKAQSIMFIITAN